VFDCLYKLLLIALTRFMREKFFKNEIGENISQKFHDQ